jgi:TonB-dependent receptor
MLIFCCSAMVHANSLMDGAGDGTVEGKVFKLENEQQQPLGFVSVYAIEAQVGTKTDFDGNYRLSLPAGDHHIIFRSVGLVADTVLVHITSQEVFSQNIELRDNKTLKKVEVFKKKDVDDPGDVTTAKETREDDKVTTKKTKKQIEATGSSDLSEAATKMTGLSTVGSVLYVRGLGDRYNTAYLNGLPVPSPNPDFRVIPLSTFPTDIIRSVSVSKVMSAELYGDFSGGAFDITTRSYYEKPTLKVSLSTGVNTQTTFKNFKTYNGGKFDYFGMDDGTRSIPSEVIANSKPGAYPGINTIFPNSLYESVEGQTTRFNDNYNFNILNKTALPNSGFSITGGNFFPTTKAKDKSSGVGFIALLNHDYSSRYSNGSIKNINAQSEERLNYDFEKWNVSTSTTGLLSLYFRINPEHNITVNSLYVNTSNDETRETWGSHFDYVDKIYSRRLTYVQSFLNSNQIIGTHKFLNHKDDKNFSRLIVDWRGSYSLTGSQEPDRRQFVAFYSEGEENDTEHYTLNFIDRNENHRFFSQLKETEIAAKGNIKFVLKYNEEKNKYGSVKAEEIISMNVGVDYKNKVRDFDYKQFNYVVNQVAQDNVDNINIYDIDAYLNSEIHDEGGFYIQEVANFGSSYRADLLVSSFYGNLKMKFGKLEIIPGVRYESAYQSVTNRNQQSPSDIDRTVVEQGSLLPSFISKLQMGEKNLMRFVFSKTLTRPKFNELAPFQYTLYFAGAKAQGNPELQNGSNYNFDVRYERYPKPGEMITVGAFYKYLDSPIEQTQLATASGQLMSFANADVAHAAGIEFEYVRSLSFLVSKAKRDSSALKYFGLGFNAAYMFTQVRIDTTQGGTINTNNIRPLEGASPYLINFDIRYERDFKEAKKKYLVALAYNVFGPRLFSVGSNGIGDQYALPVNTLNFIAKVEFNKKLSIGLKAKNLLNPNIKIVQEDRVNDGYLNVSEFRRGIDLSFSVGYSF